MHLPAMFSWQRRFIARQAGRGADYYRRILLLKPDLFTPHRLLATFFGAGKSTRRSPESSWPKVRPTDAETLTVLAWRCWREGAPMKLPPGLPKHAAPAHQRIANYQLAIIHQQRKETRRPWSVCAWR